MKRFWLLRGISCGAASVTVRNAVQECTVCPTTDKQIANTSDNDNRQLVKVPREDGVVATIILGSSVKFRTCS